MEPVKNILILSTQDPYRSSGIGAYDIFKSLRQNKRYEVRLLVETYGPYNEKGVICVKSKFEDFAERIKRKIKKRVRIKGKITTNPDYHFHIGNKKGYSTKKVLKKIDFKPDVIIVFFAQNFISYKNLKELQDITKAPIIWQFADMRPFTGGCHYAWDCNGYKKFCEKCPAIEPNKFKDFPYFELKSNYELIKNLNITAVIGSDWLIERAGQSILFKNKNIKKIFLPLDSSLFKPMNNIDNLKLKYGLSLNKKVLLIAANYLYHKRKGIVKILDALSILIERNTIYKDNLELFIVGHDFKKIKDKLPKGMSYSYSEYIDRNSLPEIYNVSDIFISASLQDVGPYTIAESLLCKVPVVSFNVGYANDFVDQKTGILVNELSSEALALGIEEILSFDKKEMIFLGENGRQVVIDKASTNNQLSKFNKLIREMLNG